MDHPKSVHVQAVCLQQFGTDRQLWYSALCLRARRLPGDVPGVTNIFMMPSGARNSGIHDSKAPSLRRPNQSADASRRGVLREYALEFTQRRFHAIGGRIDSQANASVDIKRLSAIIGVR